MCVSTSNLEIFTYFISRRWWLEQIGYWGAPGTPAPSEGSPVGIQPLSYPTLETKHDYHEIYKRGLNATYNWFPPLETIGIIKMFFILMT